MPAPSPSTNPPRWASKGRLALGGSSLAVERAVRRLKPVTPNGWIIECAPPPIITSASPRRRICGGFADRLRAGGAGRQAVHRRAARAGQQRQVRQRHVRLLLQLARDVHQFRRQMAPFHHVEGRVVRLPGGQASRRERVEIERAFAAAEIDSNAIEIELRPRRARRLSTPARTPPARTACCGRPRLCRLRSDTCSSTRKPFTSAEIGWETWWHQTAWSARCPIPRRAAASRPPRWNAPSA